MKGVKGRYLRKLNKEMGMKGFDVFNVGTLWGGIFIVIVEGVISPGFNKVWIASLFLIWGGVGLTKRFLDQTKQGNGTK